MLEIMEAYQRVLDAAEELKQSGIETVIKPSNSNTKRTGDPLPRDKWVIIIFKVKNEEEVQAVREKSKELGWSGIAFDTSGCKGEREWEIDWSFHINATPDGDWESKKDVMEDIIEGNGPQQGPECV